MGPNRREHFLANQIVDGKPFLTERGVLASQIHFLGEKSATRSADPLTSFALKVRPQ
jgi:hypothetical protein